MRNKSDHPTDVLDTIQENEENRKPFTQEGILKRDEVTPKGGIRNGGLREQPGNYESQGNKNYRKVFKPNIEGDFSTKESINMNENNPYRQKLVPLKLEENQPVSSLVNEEDYASFSNIPSRISKTKTIVNNARENNEEESSYASIHRTLPQKNTLPKVKRERDERMSQNHENDSPINQYEPPYKKAYQALNDYNSIESNIQHYTSNKQDEIVFEVPQKRNSRGFQARPQSKRNIPSNSNYNNNDERALKDSKPDNFNTETERASGMEPLVRCPEGCGRSFFESVVDKHAKTCKQVFQHKRSAFDIVRHRMTEDQKKLVGSNHNPSRLNKTAKMTKPKDALRAMPKWKQQSYAFRAMLKNAKGEQLTNDEQIAMVTNQQDEFVRCEYCNRRFNEKAAERHIPFCKSQYRKEALKRYPKGKSNLTKR